MSDVSFCIPVAPYHTEVLSRALASIEAQTVDCKAFFMIDHAEEGPGVIRNELLRAVETPYVIFLDADDWIEPTFIEECLGAILPGRYVYTDWMQSDEYRHAPARPWCGGTWHPITTLLSTAFVRQVGGFNETLEALEDTEFYLKLTTRRICGVHVQKALFHYGSEGRRAKTVHENGRVQFLRDEIHKTFGGKMGCCGEDQTMQEQVPIGAKQSGDVLAMALWGGNHPEYGRATGRRYPRMSYPKTTWVHPADIEIRPDMWRQVIEPAVTDTVRYTGVEGFAQALRERGQLGQRAEPVTPENFTRADVNPNVKRITEIARKRLGK
jgi:hypothetical protein